MSNEFYFIFFVYMILNGLILYYIHKLKKIIDEEYAKYGNIIKLSMMIIALMYSNICILLFNAFLK